jgi:hypothetical protein
VKPRKKRTLTAAERRALGATLGLMVHRLDPQDRARLEQLAPESRSLQEHSVQDPRPFLGRVLAATVKTAARVQRMREGRRKPGRVSDFHPPRPNLPGEG